MENNKTLTNAFFWLFIGLLTCFGVSFLSMNYVDILYTKANGIIFIVVEIAVALALSLFIRKIPPMVARVLYIVYTAITGLSLTGIFYIYTTASICYVFLATAAIFGVFAVIGKTTKIDMTKWWLYLFIGLIAVLVLEIINIFIANNTLNMITCIAAILIFSGYVAYDVNRLVNSSYLEETGNKGIYFAFQLFLDFINLFIKLLRLFGKTRD